MNGKKYLYWWDFHHWGFFKIIILEISFLKLFLAKTDDLMDLNDIIEYTEHDEDLKDCTVYNHSI